MRLEPGDPAPDFRLLNQDGDAVLSRTSPVEEWHCSSTRKL